MGYVKKEDGKTNWNALANIKIGQYMRALSYGDMIKSFNANTNDVSTSFCSLILIAFHQ